MPSVQDDLRTKFLEALGLTTSTLSNPDLERQALLDALGLTVETGAIYSNADLRRLAGYPQTPTFTGFEFDPFKTISGLQAYYSADKLAGQILAEDDFTRRGLASWTNTTGWQVLGGAGNGALTTDATNVYVGTDAFKFVSTTTTPNLFIGSSNSIGTYTISWYELVANPTTTRAGLWGGSASGGSATGDPTEVFSNGTWRRMSQTVTITSGTAIYIALYPQSASVSGRTYYYDAVQVEEGSVATPYSSAKELGVSKTGHVWTNLSGTVDNPLITNGSLGSASAGGSPGYWVTNVGATDYEISATIVTNSIAQNRLVHGIVIGSDSVLANQRISLTINGGRVSFTRITGASGTFMSQSGANSALDGTHTLMARVSNGIAKAYLDGVELLSTGVESMLLTNTWAGVMVARTPGSTIDDFSVKTLPVMDGLPVAAWPDLSGNYRHAIQNTYTPPNLLTQNQATIETDTTGFVAIGGTATGLSRSTARMSEGTASLTWSVPIAGSPTSTVATLTGTSGRPVTPGLSYAATADLAHDSIGTRSFNCSILWFKADGSASTVLAKVSSASASVDNASFLTRSITGVAPSDAAFASVQVESTNTALADSMYADKLGLFQSSTVPTWRAPNDPSGYLSRPLLRTASRNLLTYNQATIETDTTGWNVSGNCTLARVTTQARHGSASLSLTSLAAGVANANIITMPISPNTTYTVMAKYKSATVSRVVRVWMQWRTAADAFISSSIGNVSSTTDSWTNATITATAPSNATGVRVIIEATGTGAAGEIHYVDEIGLFEGTVTEWVPPVTLPNSRAAVQFDGVDDALDSTDNAGNVPQTIIAVTYPTGAESSRTTTAGSSPTGALQLRYNIGRSYNLLHSGVISLSGSVGANAVEEVAVIVAHWTGLSGGGAYSIHKNGTSIASGTSVSASPSAVNSRRIGATGTVEHFAGGIALLATYNRVLTDAERKKIEKYLGTRYGITVAP